MESVFGTDLAANFATASYVSEDAIENLALRVTVVHSFGVRTTTSTKKDPLLEAVNNPKSEFNANTPAKRSAALTPIAKAKGKAKSGEDKKVVTTVRWQRKILCPRQVKRLRAAQPAVLSEAEREYQTMVQHMDTEAKLEGASKATGHRVFTMVDEDRYVHAGEEGRRYTTSGSHAPTPLEAQRLKARKESEEAVVKPMGMEGAKHMYILFEPFVGAHNQPEGSEDLPSPAAASSKDVLLCRLTALPGGVLSVQPGFGTGYVVSTATDTFEFSIENVSEGRGTGEEAKTDVQMKNLRERQSNLKEHLTGRFFTEPPPAGSVRATVLGEIVSARNFPRDNLYIEYEIDDCPGWMISDGTVLSGTTQRVSAKRRGRDDIYHYGYPFHMEMIWTPPKPNAVPTMPRVYFQVSSYDWWDRNRVEGYGYVDVPASGGSYLKVIPTWRPVPTVREALRSFFIGGSPQIEDVSYVGVPTDFETGRPLSKFGFETEASGAISVRLNVMYQRREDVSVAAFRPAGGGGGAGAGGVPYTPTSRLRSAGRQSRRILRKVGVNLSVKKNN